MEPIKENVKKKSIHENEHRLRDVTIDMTKIFQNYEIMW